MEPLTTLAIQCSGLHLYQPPRTLQDGQNFGGLHSGFKTFSAISHCSVRIGCAANCYKISKYLVAIK